MSATETQSNYTELNNDDNMERFFNSLIDSIDPSMKDAPSPGSDSEACYQPIILSSMCSTEPNYKQLNYQDNIERFFSSLQLNSNEPSMEYASSSAPDNYKFCTHNYKNIRSYNKAEHENVDEQQQQQQQQQQGTSNAMENFIPSYSSSTINTNSSNNVEDRRGQNMIITKPMLDLHNEIIKMQMLQEYRNKQRDIYNRHLHQMTSPAGGENTKNKKSKLSQHTALSSEPQLLLEQSINQSRKMYTTRAKKSESTKRARLSARYTKNHTRGTRA